MDDMNGYQLSRDWFDFCFDNPEKIRPIHTAIYFFAVEHCNRLGWKKKFGFPTQMAMEAIGIKNWRTYNNAFTDIVDWGFVHLIKKSKNQYSSCVISLCKKYSGSVEATTKSLDKALLKHAQKQSSNTVVIDKQLNNEQGNKEPLITDQKIADVIGDIDSISDKNILLALHIWRDVDSLQPNNKTTQRAIVKNWSEPIRLMIEQDDRAYKEIWELWKRVQKDEFWRGNVLSTSKLRDQYDHLNIKLNRLKKNHDELITELYR